MRPPSMYGVRAIAAETGVNARFVALLAREGYANIIWSLVMVEQRRRRRRRRLRDEVLGSAKEIV